MVRSVVVLNANYQYLNTISWQKAITLVFQAKVDVLSWSDDVISNSSKSFEMLIPKIIRLVKMVRKIYKNRVPYSKRNIFTRDKFTCQYCDVKLKVDECTLDHVVPSSIGGKSEWDNCVCACQKCNHNKGDKSLRDINMYLKRSPYTPTINEFLLLKVETLGIDKYINEILENLV
jgi:5-methylcytosine-specific restriction endonuclease McrA